MKVKKIILVGEFLPGAAAWSYERVLKSLGHEVTCFDVKRYARLDRYGKIGYGVRRAGDVLLNAQLVSLVKKLDPDLIFLAKAENVHYKTLRKIKQQSRSLLVNFYPDNPFVFWNGNSNAHVLRSLPLYDHFLIWSKLLLEPLRSAGANASYFPFVYDENLFPSQIALTPDDEARYAHDVCFVGTWDVEREFWLESLVMVRPDLDLAIWGNDWPDRLSKQSPLRKFYKGSAVYDLERLKLFRLCKIVLNFIRAQNMTSHNMRTMEVPASRAFLLTERTVEQARELFEEGVSIACFASPEELAAKIDYYLEHEAERAAIVEKSFERVRRYSLQRELARFTNNLWG